MKQAAELWSGQTRGRGRSAAVALAAGAALALTSCSSGGDAKEAAKSPQSSAPAPAATASASSADAGPQAAEEKAVLEVYKRYRQEQTKAYAAADYKSTRVQKYVTGDALGQLVSDIEGLKNSGSRTEGSPVTNPKVTALSASGKRPTAAIADCFDVTHWKVVNRASGKAAPRPKGQLKRYVIDLTLEKWGNRWMILKEETQNRGC
ncbi:MULTISPECIES: hypothetical protein [unclassified Streptomyces]|uniref:hypothetical protein n=1 Tax=unclassified Streptomyces TaxID=2593676 RepID=UPI002DDBD950|nr:hypothetical protein [Streptomyces sp. NBC_01766]WSC24921.1 hypothetical protein OIE60_35220 [Streptomyces sp. NBC_01766]